MTYFDWLVYLVAPDFETRDRYTDLFFALYSTEFFWVIPRDRNRASDGLDLRDRYEQETGLYADLYGPCNCLELLAALAIRCENDIMYDPDFGDRTSEWFWMILENLGLDREDNAHFDFDETDEILYRFMNREYGIGGKYCAFPCQKSLSVLKKMELAYQMNYFLKEKFY